MCPHTNSLLVPLVKFVSFLFKIFYLFFWGHSLNLFRNLLSPLSHKFNSVKGFFRSRLSFHNSKISRGVLISKILCPYFIFTELYPLILVMLTMCLKFQLTRMSALTSVASAICDFTDSLVHYLDTFQLGREVQHL